MAVETALYHLFFIGLFLAGPSCRYISVCLPPFHVPVPVPALSHSCMVAKILHQQAQGANVASSKMKEAKGQKAYDAFEIVARTMLFRPTFTVLAPEDAASVSSVHALVGPVLSLMEGSENGR